MGFVSLNPIPDEEFVETPESIDMRKKEFLRNFVAEFMEKFTGWVGDAHVKCSKDGLITDTSVAIDESSNYWSYSTEDMSIVEFLGYLKYINEDGKEVAFDLDNHTEKDLYQCIKYFMTDEVTKRADSVHISKDEYLNAMLSEDIKDTLYETIEEKAYKETDGYFEDSLMSPVEWEDIAKAATPAFRDLHIHNLLFQISTSIELLNDCSEVEVAVSNVEKLKELADKVKKADPKEVIPDSAIEDCYESVGEYAPIFCYYDLLDKEAFYDNLISKCQQYTYTLPEVTAVLFKGQESDSYTVDADKAKLHEIVEAHPTQISKDGVPYSTEEIDTMVELASSIGWEAAGRGIGEILTK